MTLPQASPASKPVDPARNPTLEQGVDRWPETIYLQRHEDCVEAQCPSYHEGETTWCIDKIHATDVRYVRADRFDSALRSLQSAINTLQDIAAMGKKAGSESAKHRLIQLGIDVPDYGSMT